MSSNTGIQQVLYGFPAFFLFIYDVLGDPGAQIVLWLRCRSFFWRKPTKSLDGNNCYDRHVLFVTTFCARLSYLFFCEIHALLFCSFTQIYNENAMLFSALYVVIPFFQRLSCDIANFTYFSTKKEEIHSFLKFFSNCDGAFFSDHDERAMDRTHTAIETFMICKFQR